MALGDKKRLDNEMERLVLENERLERDNARLRRYFSLTEAARRVFKPAYLLTGLGLAVGVGAAAVVYDSIALKMRENERVYEAMHACRESGTVCSQTFEAVSSPVLGRERGPYQVENSGLSGDSYISSEESADGTIRAVTCENYSIELRRMSDNEILHASTQKLCR